MLFILERALKFHNPWILSLNQNISLSFHMRNLIFVKHFSLLHFFHGYNFSSFFKSANSDLSKSSSTNDAKRLKILDGNFLSPKQDKPSHLNTIFCLVQPPCVEYLAWWVLTLIHSNSTFAFSLRACPKLQFLYKANAYLLSSLSPHALAFDTSSRCKPWHSQLFLWSLE